MSTRVKPGVKLGHVTAMVTMQTVVSETMRAFGVDCVITSANDSEHKANSLHYTDRALDYRTRDLQPSMRKFVAVELQRRLGEEFDVVLEDDHLHVEWDPEPRDVIV